MAAPRKGSLLVSQNSKKICANWNKSILCHSYNKEVRAYKSKRQNKPEKALLEKVILAEIPDFPPQPRGSSEAGYVQIAR